MALKLFHSTGYSTLLMPGEARLAMHPAWLVLMVSLWIGLACNVALWRIFSTFDLRSLLATFALLAGGTGAVLSLLAWRRILKLATTLLLLAAALFACGLWVQQLPVESLWQQRPRGLLPSWPNFLRWQVLALVLVLAVVPIVWVWNTPVRRLPGPAQLRSSIGGALLGGLAFGFGLFLAASG